LTASGGVEKEKTKMTTKLIAQEVIQNRILVVGGLRGMLDSDLAELYYGISNHHLKRARSGFPAES
jgi:hypothetical protein